MKPFEKLFIFILLFFFVNSTCTSFLEIDENTSVEDIDWELYSEPDGIDNSASSSSCHSRSFSSLEQANKAYKCCYYQSTCDDDGDKEKTKVCMAYDQDSYKRVKEQVKYLKKVCDDVKIDCKSSYIHLAIISIILMLL